MEINEKHIKVLKSIKAIKEGHDQVINPADAEECVELGLIEPGYKFTSHGLDVLKELDKK